MNKPNYEEVVVEYKGRTIKASNWWNWRLQGSADLYIDDIHIDENRDKIANPHKPLLSKQDVSEDIKSIEVFVSFFTTLKFKVVVNGEVIHEDKLNALDKVSKVFFPV